MLPWFWLRGGGFGGWIGEMGPETGPEGRVRLISICSNKCGHAATRLLSAWKIKWDLQSSGLLRLMCSNYQLSPARYRLSCQEIDETDRRLPVLILSSVLFTLSQKTDDINKSAFGRSGSSAANLTHSACRHQARADTVNTAGWHTLACSAWVQPQMSWEFAFHEKWNMWATGKKLFFIYLFIFFCRKRWYTINLSHRFSPMVRS